MCVELYVHTALNVSLALSDLFTVKLQSRWGDW